MHKYIHFLVFCIILLASCTSDFNESISAIVPEASPSGQVDVSLTTTIPEVTYEPLTRAAATGVSRLVLAIFDAEGNAVSLNGNTQLNQTAGDTNFGTFTGIRLTPGTYTFVCVGHKCGSATTGHATITSPTSVTLPDPGVFTTYSLVKDVTITRSATMQQNVQMQLAASYSEVKIVTKDNISTGTSKVRLTLNPDGTETDTYTFNPTDHLTTANIKSVAIYDISSKVGKPLNEDMKFLLPANPQHFTLLVETLDASNNVLTTRTYDKDQANNDILYYLGRTTKINTYLFSVGTTTTVTLEDWGADNEYDID